MGARIMISKSKIEEIHKITSGWKGQTELADCMVCSIFNLACEISSRPVAPLQKTFTLSEIATCLGYVPEEGTSWYNLDAGMKKMMNMAKSDLWYGRVSDTDRHQPVSKVCDIVNNPTTSYPTLTLGAEYLRDTYNLTLPKNPFAWISHMVILVLCENEECVIYDPYATHLNLDPVRVMTKSKLIEYWRVANVPRGVAWFERNARVLEEFQGAKS